MLQSIRWLALFALLHAGQSVAADYDPHRLGDDVRPLRQEVWLELDADRADYHGRTTIELRLERPMAAFRMHAQDIEIVSVELAGRDFEGKLLHRRDELGLVILSAPMVLGEGRYRLSIEFRNEFSAYGVGLYRVVQGGQGYIYSQMQAVEARKSFPCFDEPGFKYPWRFTVRAPEEYPVIHNTPAQSEQLADGWRETVFAETRPLPSYLIALASGPFASVEIPELSVPGRIVLLPGQEPLARLAAEMTGPILAALEEYFGEPYPYEKLDFIAAADFWYGAMENPGAVVFRDRLLLVDAERASIGQRRTLARIIGHELAHMWFGNAVTMAWWDELWLNESFADWLGTQIADQVFPSLGIAAQVYADSIEPMRGDGRSSALPIRSDYRAADDFTRNLGLKYAKGKRVLGMFERHLGAETFRKAVRAYIEAHRWGNANSEDLWRSLAAVTDSDVDRAIAGFIDQPGIPMLSIERMEGGLRLVQQRYATYAAELESQQWQVPVRLRYSIDGREQAVELLLGAHAAAVELPEGRLEWLVPNVEGSGYYHWKLEPELLAALARAPLGALETVDLLGNLGALLDAGMLEGDRYLEMLQAAGRDAEGVVLEQLIRRLEALRDPFGAEVNGTAFGDYLRTALMPALDRIGVLPRSGEPEEAAAVRPALLRLLGVDARDPTVVAFAAELTRQYLDDTSSLDPELAEAALRVHAVSGNAALQRELRERAESAASPVERNILLAAFASFHSPRRQQAALEYALGDALKPSERWTQLWRAASIPGRRDELLDWLFANYEQVTAGLPPETEARMPLFAGGCSINRLARARQFFADPARRVAGTEHQLERTGDAVRQCVALQQREGDRVSAWLAQGKVND